MANDLGGSGQTSQALDRPFKCFYLRVVWPIAGLLLLGVATVMLWEAIDRTLFSHSYIWAEETIRYLLLWIVFLCFGLAGVRRQHLRSDLLLRMMPAKVQHACGLLADIAGLAFCSLLFAGSVVQFNQLYDTGMMTEALFDIPLWVIFAVVPVGAALYGLSYLLSMLGMLPRETLGEHEIPSVD